MDHLLSCSYIACRSWKKKISKIFIPWTGDLHFLVKWIIEIVVRTRVYFVCTPAELFEGDNLQKWEEFCRYLRIFTICTLFGSKRFIHEAVGSAPEDVQQRQSRPAPRPRLVVHTDDPRYVHRRVFDQQHAPSTHEDWAARERQR